MAESGQRSEASSAVRSPSPAPRKKVTISLTAAQAAELRVLWQEHSAALYAMLTGWCGDPQNASDLLQEVFRRLAESPSIVGKMKNARAFLAVSARRLAVDFSRRSATRVAYQAAAGIEVPIVHNPGPTDENLRMAIRGALDLLPTEQRAVFDHKILKGRTLEEISKIEAISLNTAASRLRYALDKIRGQLRPYYDDLNLHQFKKMKNDLLTDESNNTKRIITPLEPKRVPSVLPGLEGLAALSADDGSADAPDQVEFIALPAVEGPAPDQVDVEPQVHIDPVFVAPIAVSVDPISEATEDHSFETNVDAGSDHSGEDPVAWLAIEEPLVIGEVSDMGENASECIYVPEDFMTGIFEGSIDSTDSGGDPVPFDLENGFEICVLPVSYDFVSPDADTDYSSLFDSNRLLADYTSFLSDNPDWVDYDEGEEMQAQVITASSYFDDLEFGNPGEAAAFDTWFETTHVSQNDNHDEGGDGSGVIEPFWRGGSDIAYAMSSPGAVVHLSFLDSDAVTTEHTSSFPGSTVVTGGEVVLGGNDVTVDHAHSNVVTLSNGSDIVLEGGRVVEGENVYTSDHDFASHDQAGALPVEIATTEFLGTESAPAWGNVATGLAPTPGQSLIVEFGVLSQSEVVTTQTEASHELPASMHSLDELPDVVALSSTDAVEENVHAAFSAHAVAAGDSGSHAEANPHDVVAGADADAPVAANKHDSTTMAAGAVAVGSVAHGTAAMPLAGRKPLPKV